MRFNSLLINLDNIFKKEKELNKGFFFIYLLFNRKRAFKLFIRQLNYQKINVMFLKPTSIYTGPLYPHVSFGG
jgi:hypothetical protein